LIPLGIPETASSYYMQYVFAYAFMVYHLDILQKP
jgi:hypothetical protein